jgi:hypothetical protein
MGHEHREIPRDLPGWLIRVVLEIMPERGMRGNDTQVSDMRVHDRTVRDMTVHGSLRHRKLSFPPF